MAELRDRFSSHGFDDKGNDFDNKAFESIAKSLSGLTQDLKVIGKAFQEQKKTNKILDQLNKQEFYDKLGRGLANAPRNIVSSVGSGVAEATKTVAGGVAETTGNIVRPSINTALAASGPIGYMLAAGLNVGKGVTSLVSAFGRGAFGKKKDDDGLSTRGGTGGVRGFSGDNTLSLNKGNFESLPTMVKLRSWLNFQTKDNPLFRKYMLKMQDKARQTEKFEKDQQKVAKAQKEILGKMEKDTSTTALQSKLIVGGVLLAGVAILGLALWLKENWNKDWLKNPFDRGPSGDDTAGENITHGGFKITETSQGHYNRYLDRWYARGKYNTAAGRKHAAELHATWGTVERFNFYANNRGIDIAPIDAKAGSYIRSHGGGIAIGDTSSSSYGYQVVVLVNQEESTKAYGSPCFLQIRYAHLQEIDKNITLGRAPYPPDALASGTKIKRGDLLGRQGGAVGVKGSGSSTGVHTHIDVMVFGVKDGKPGEYKGYVDPDKLHWDFGPTYGKGVTTSAGFSTLAVANTDTVKAIREGKSIPQIKSQTPGLSVAKATYSASKKTKSDLDLAVVQAVTGRVGHTDADIKKTLSSLSTEERKRIENEILGTNISTTGKNDATMDANNIKLLGKQVLSTTPIGLNPILNPNSPVVKTVQTIFNFDTSNDATKLMKNNSNSIIFNYDR